MLDKFRYTAATDKDVFDLLISGGSKFGQKTLLDIALNRGIFYSHLTEKEEIATSISLYTHDYNFITEMVDKREKQFHNDKRSFAELPVQLTKEDVDDVIEAYKKTVAGAEEISISLRTPSNTRLNVAYDEIDYSKTRLIQRRRKDAPIEIETHNDRTIFRMPANERARRIVDGLCEQSRKKKLQNVDAKQISLEGMTGDERSNFFMTLIRNIPGYILQTVVTMKFSHSDIDEYAEEDDDSNENTTSEDIISKINSIAISGENLLQTAEYQQFKNNGFFFTALTWRAKQEARPHDLMQFDVSFDNPQEGTGFKFGVRIARKVKEAVTNDFQPLEAQRQPSMWKLIERASADALESVRSTKVRASEVA